MTEWLLAFDTGCQACSDVIGRVRAQVEDRVTVTALSEPRISELRRRALGERPRFAPTLIAVDRDRVRAWTGPRLSARLAWLLGPARSIAVMRALNHADVVVNGDRRSLLKAIPLAALGAFVVSGGLAAPAMATGSRPLTAAKVDAMVDRLQPLPSRYADFVQQPMAVRRGVYDRLSPPQRAGLWQEHLALYRSEHPDLTGTQAAALEQALALLPAVFGPADGAGGAPVEQARSAAIAAFGRRQAAAVFGTLGPLEQSATTSYKPNDGEPCNCFCDCAPDFTPCDGCGQEAWTCIRRYQFCGFLYLEDCTGLCGGA
jgi:hypothetical protein